MQKQQQQPVRVMLADDHPIVMTGFAMSLAAQGMEVVGQAKTPSEAAAMYAEQKPDVAVLDIRFGTELTGLDAAQNILRADPQAKIVFLSQFDQDSLIKETYRLGAHAFVTKDCDPADLADAVGLVARPVDVHVQRWGGGLPQYAVGHLDRVARIRAAVAEVAGLAVCGAAYDGVGIPAVIASAQRVVTDLRRPAPS